MYEDEDFLDYLENEYDESVYLDDYGNFKDRD